MAYMAQLVRFRVRQGLKDYLRAAAEQVRDGGDPRSLSDIVRWALEECLSSRLSPDAARELIRIERWALDGVFTPPISLYRYRDTPWTTVNVQLDPALLDALRGDAARLGVKRDELMRGALFDTLFPRFDRPPNQWLTAPLDYAEIIDWDTGKYLDPRHPTNRGRERAAIARLRYLGTHPDRESVSAAGTGPPYYESARDLMFTFQRFLGRLETDYHRFTQEGDDADETDQAR